MSYCKKEGKDIIIFATKKDHELPSTVQLPEPERPTGIIRPDGTINWGCPCLGGMPTGPCGIEFREAFTCFNSSQAEPKGSDCLDAFSAMQECFKKYPTLYGGRGDIDTKNSDEEENSRENEKIRSSVKAQSSSVENIPTSKKN